MHTVLARAASVPLKVEDSTISGNYGMLCPMYPMPDLLGNVESTRSGFACFCQFKYFSFHYGRTIQLMLCIPSCIFLMRYYERSTDDMPHH